MVSTLILSVNWIGTLMPDRTMHSADQVHCSRENWNEN
ncbi:hypothetical protein NIES2104_20580 [Leptolyngbya sp. NIES-2104]|nr:hypothetical protein NIES2104_20580 [Leptolyngbya sp. NIES-2104]